ncbi:MAG TPA: monofunctional biosynthetic peptidoglycan transglycosylase [Steroidobacter sp.]
MASRLPRRILGLLFRTVLACVLLPAALVLLLRWVDPPASAFMLRERWSGTTGHPRPLHHEWVPWSRIPAPMKLAVIAAEDQRFFEHHGFDLHAINDALEDRARGRIRGASTISQQVAKNLFLWPGQSWVRKGLEACLTVLIEALWPKERILEVYLNVAEFGKGVYGVGAAAEVLLKKRVDQLDARDAALLAAVLPSPKRMRVDAPSRYVRSRQQWILVQMQALGGPEVIEQREAQAL